MADYDIVTVGGGLGGAAIAKAMAERGYKVLVTEREKKFKDRVRGEWTAPWGVAEAKELGIYDALLAAGGHHTPIMGIQAGPMPMPVRNLIEESALGIAPLAMFHPDMQECVIAEATKAGAEVRRGVKARNVTPGREPTVEIESNGGTETVSARLVVGADGRNSMVRKWGNFEVTETEPAQILAGVLIDNAKLEQDKNVIVFNPVVNQIAIIFPQSGSRARAYFGYRSASSTRLQGDGDFQKLIDMSIQTGAAAALYEGVTQAGPVASFEGYDSFVEHPYKDSVALVGDAAQTSDQTWGQGLSVALRDVRLLRDALLETDDWDAAGHKYAEASNWCFQHIRRLEDWLTLIVMTPGAEGDAARAKALPRLMADPGCLPDTHIAGPELAPADEAAYAKLFGE
jgi:2-polyprenyl-6-methoxyphenol hydroxylase-like FAD-dependent oxidoreductase